MTSTRSAAVLAAVALLGLYAVFLVSSGCFGCGGLTFESGSPPPGVDQHVEAAAVVLTVAISLVAVIGSGYRILQRRRSA